MPLTALPPPPWASSRAAAATAAESHGRSRSRRAIQTVRTATGGRWRPAPTSGTNQPGTARSATNASPSRRNTLTWQPPPRSSTGMRTSPPSATRSTSMVGKSHTAAVIITRSNGAPSGWAPGFIGREHRDVPETECGKIGATLCRQFGDDLDPRHRAALTHEARHHRRKPAGAGTDLQHLLPGPQIQQMQEPEHVAGL